MDYNSHNKLNFGLDPDDGEAFAIMPLGAVRAEKWLKKQLELMRDGITGDMEKYPDYSFSEWLGERGGENWERGPYYLRGLVALAYVLDDKELIGKSDRWINAILSSQRDGGMFGPVSNSEWWSRMPALIALRDYLEALEYNGKSDERVIPFITEYFRYQEKHLPGNPLRDWARARGGDNIDSVYWLYSRLYDRDDPDKTKWLLDLASLLYSQTQDWRHIMNDTTVREHVVNTSQALKAPVLYYQQSGDDRDRSAFENAIRNFGIDHGRIDGLPNSDEAARDNRSTRGSELCGIVEGMLSTEIALRILREPWIGDRLERLAYNALPSGYSYDYKSHVYYILQNQVMATGGYHEFDCDHGDSSAFGAPCGFDCCFANNHMGWPKFVQSMWMATKRGIAAVAYGPCRLNFDGIVFEERTDYPFRDRIEFVYRGEEREFELALRIPEWCHAPRLSVNGEERSAARGSFARIDRKWSSGDVCALVLESDVEIESGYNMSVAFTKGALIYTLPVSEEWKAMPDNNARELKVPTHGSLLNSEVRPVSAWNYAVFDSQANYVETGRVAEHPFTPSAAPAAIKIKGVRVRSWTLDGNIAAVQPYGGAKEDITKAEMLTLIPYGCARLKVTHLPRVGARELVWYPKYHSSMEFAEFKGITLPEARNYDIVLFGEGTGSAIINGAFTCDVCFVDGKHVIKSAKTLIGDRHRVFTRDHYNNIRIYGAKVDRVQIIPVKEYNEICISEITARDSSVSLVVNTDKSFCPFTVKYGEESGRYHTSVEGFKGNTAHIDGLKCASDYYFVIEAVIKGETVRSEEYRVRTLEAVDDSIDPPGAFAIESETAFECAQITFDRVPGAEYFEIAVSNDGEVFDRTVTDIRFNPYKGGGIFACDKTALTLESGRSYILKMTAYRAHRPISVSNKIRVTI